MLNAEFPDLAGYIECHCRTSTTSATVTQSPPPACRAGHSVLMNPSHSFRTHLRNNGNTSTPSTTKAPVTLVHRPHQGRPPEEPTRSSDAHHSSSSPRHGAATGHLLQPFTLTTPPPILVLTAMKGHLEQDQKPTRLAPTTISPSRSKASTSCWPASRFWCARSQHRASSIS